MNGRSPPPARFPLLRGGYSNFSGHGKVCAMPTRTTQIAAAGLVTALGLTLITGCSGGGASPTSSTAPMSESPSPIATGTPVKFDTTLTSSYSSLDDVGPKEDLTYGVNVLSGTTTINDHSVRVKMGATIDNSDGTGPLGGFLTLTWSDGTTLGLRQSGTATSDGKDTDYEAQLEVIGGTEEAEGVTGSGTLVGKRKSGSTSIKIDVDLSLSNAPESITGAPKAPKAPTQSYNATIAP